KEDQDRLLRNYEAAKGPTAGGITAQTIRDVLRDRPLTSGIFYLIYPAPEKMTAATLLDILRNATIKPNGTIPPGFVAELPNGDDPRISALGKCRHGWSLSYTHWSGANATYLQAGINKDEPEANLEGFNSAQRLAFDHTYKYVMDVLTDPMLTGTPNYTSMMLGLMGYEQASVLDSFRIGIPGAPNGESWDTVTGGLLRLNLKNIQPDISVCVESTTVP